MIVAQAAATPCRSSASVTDDSTTEIPASVCTGMMMSRPSSVRSVDAARVERASATSDASSPAESSRPSTRPVGV